MFPFLSSISSPGRVLCVAHLCRRCLLDASFWCLGVWFPSFFLFLWVPSRRGGRGASRSQDKAPRPRAQGATRRRPTGFWSAHHSRKTTTTPPPASYSVLFWLPSFCPFSSLSFPLLPVSPSLLHFPCLSSPQAKQGTSIRAALRHGDTAGDTPRNGPLLRGPPCH